MLEFAESEIIIPDGPYEGRRFRAARQPYSRHWFDLVHEGWYECVITGPSQSGKTLVGFVIPVLYHLFERRQKVIAAVPDFDMVRDKWSADILPALERTRYRNLVPKGGRVSARQALIEFDNGAHLRFMTAGGSDKSRAAYTAPVVCMTETDGFDVRMTTSDEANKIEQIEARMRAFPLRERRIYKECTVSVAEGHTWNRYSEGTATRLYTRCPHCRAFVSLEREHFTGWENAKTDVQAIEGARFACYACGVVWSEDDREQANSDMRVVHRGQEIKPDGTIIGDAALTRTLGFRWSAVNNLLVPAADAGLDEWKAARPVDEDDEERKMSQFVWCVPYEPKEYEESKLTDDNVRSRIEQAPRGECPDHTRWITVGVDVNKPVLHWAAIAWAVIGTEYFGRIIDYGKQGIRVGELGFEAGVSRALRRLHADLGSRWKNTPDQLYARVVVDTRWSPTEIGNGLIELGDRRWRQFIGLGQGHWKRRAYTHPDQSTGKVWVGNQCYEKLVRTRKAKVTFADANFWKTWLTSRLTMDIDEKRDGRLTLFRPIGEAEELERATFARHLTAEKEIVRFERGKGYIKEWETLRPANHWLDATYMACVAGNRYCHRIRPRATISKRTVNNEPLRISPFSKRA